MNEKDSAQVLHMLNEMMDENDRAGCPSSSALDRYVECPPSHNMGLLATSWGQNKEAGTDAKFGLRVHSALHEGTAKGLETDDERNAFYAMYRAHRKFVEGWKRAFWTTPTKSEELLEHRMWLHAGAVPIFTGQADYILVKDSHALICDFKSLWNKVAEPQDNHQLRSLAVLLWLTRPDLTDVTIQVISPHYYYSPHTMSRSELEQYLEFLQTTIKLVNQAGSPVPGEYCKHCRGLLICPAVRKKASDLLRADEDGQLPTRLPKGDSGAKLLDEMTALSALVDKIREHYKSVLIEDPKAVPGWQLSTRTTRAFKDVQNVFRMLQNRFGDEVFDLLSISVPKTFGKLNSIDQQKMEEFVERTESAPGLRKKGNGD